MAETEKELSASKEKITQLQNEVSDNYLLVSYFCQLNLLCWCFSYMQRILQNLFSGLILKHYIFSSRADKSSKTSIFCKPLVKAHISWKSLINPPGS